MKKIYLTTVSRFQALKLYSNISPSCWFLIGYFESCFNFFFSSLQAEYNRLKDIKSNGVDNGRINGAESARDTELLAEAKILREHKGKLEARMQILEDHNRQLEAQLQKLRQLLEQVGWCFLHIESRGEKH